MPSSRQLGTVLVFTAAIFVSSALLFGVQPLVGKMLLPLLGGTPAVWNTCMVFFQAVLLAGYGYAHFLAGRSGRPWRLVHLALLVGAFLTLPIAITPDNLPTETDPTLWILSVLTVAVGLPFLAVSTTAPLLQAWFSRSDHPRAHDPYFLYAASNAGSVLALLAYPFLIERLFPVPDQAEAWRWGFLGFVAIATVAALQPPRKDAGESEETGAETASESPTWALRLRWLALSFVPSSLMLGVTTYIATDVASFPLLWVIPLALYLISFILVFGRSSWRPSALLGRIMSLVVVALLVAFILGASHPTWLVIPLHLVAFMLAAVVLHGELAHSRPTPKHLTEFYLLMSLGGVLGGAFNAILAPQVFDGIWEYPLMMIAACALRRTSPEEDDKAEARHDLWRFAPIAVAAIAFACLLGANALDVQITRTTVLLVFGPPAVLAYAQVESPRRYAAGLLALLVAGMFYSGTYGKTLEQNRTFFGTVRVTSMDDGRFTAMVHGNTIHGRVLEEKRDECLPLAYFHPTGPVGGIFRHFRTLDLPPRVGMIGLGVGAQACYAKPHESFTYYELDPEVLRLARDTDYFELLAHSNAKEMRYVLGDARVQIARELDEQKYGMLTIDAFSSDAIPVHLLTVEAFQTYLDRIHPDGLLAMHISNKYMDLAPVIANIAARLDLQAYIAEDLVVPPDLVRIGKEPSRWVMLSPRDEPLDLPPKWRKLDGDPDEAWTDAYSDVLSVLRW